MHLHARDHLDPLHHELRHLMVTSDRIRHAAKIDHADLDFAPILCINNTAEGLQSV